MKKILLPTVVTMSLLFAVGCSNSNDKADELKDQNNKEVELNSNQSVADKKEEVLPLDITSTIMYKNYTDILSKMNSLSVDEINKMIESSTDKFITNNHIDHEFSDSGHQLLNEFRYNIRDEEEVVLGVTYDAYNSSGDRLPLSEAVVSFIYLEVKDDIKIAAVNNEDVQYSVTFKTNEFTGIKNGFDINSSLNDMYAKIANILSENENISIKDIQEKVGISFDSVSEGIITNSDDPAVTTPTEVTNYTLKGDDSYILIQAIDDKVYQMILNPMYNFGEEVKVSGNYHYYNRRVLEPKRVEELDPEYKPEYFATKEVSDIQQQIELLNSLM